MTVLYTALTAAGDGRAGRARSSDSGPSLALPGETGLLHRAPNVLPIPGTSGIGHLEENVPTAGIALDSREIR
jgi:pyridoxine 4-dehydrogenase